MLSFIYRYASANQISILAFWSYVKSENLLYSKMSTLNMLEMIPTSILNLELFSQVTDISKDELLSMTYHYVQFKFSHSEEVTQSRIMKETIRDILYFCPQCLDKQNYIRLKWKIRGMDICLKHNTPLSTVCPSCNQQILLKNYQYDSQCPMCQNYLCGGKKEKHSDSDTTRQQQWLSDQWDTLFQISKRNYSPIDIAQKLIWFLNHQKIYLDMRELRIFCSDHQIDLQYLLKFARGTLQKKRSIHVFQLLKILDVCKIDVACIFEVKVPLEFIEKHFMDHPYTIAIECRALWCSSYRKSKSLKNKGTQYKRLKNGHVQRSF